MCVCMCVCVCVCVCIAYCYNWLVMNLFRYDKPNKCHVSLRCRLIIGLLLSDVLWHFVDSHRKKRWYSGQFIISIIYVSYRSQYFSSTEETYLYLSLFKGTISLSRKPEHLEYKVSLFYYSLIVTNRIIFCIFDGTMGPNGICELILSHLLE